MIDSDVNGNFLLQRIANVLGFGKRKKKEFYDLIIVDEFLLFTDNERVKYEIYLLPVVIHKHHEKLIFDIVEMTTHDVVLGMF